MILKDIIKKFDKSNIKAGDGLEFGNYPLYTCSPIINKYLNDYHYDEEAIIVSTGGNFSVHYVNGKFNYSTDCYVFNTDKYNLKYLYYYLISKSDDINKMFRGAGLKHLNKNEFVMLNIKDIPMEEQKSIVNQLDKIKKMIDLRKNEIEKYNELIKSQFVEMFGEPLTSNNYGRISLKQLTKVRQGLQIPIAKRKNAPGENRYKYITIQYLHGGKETEYIENPNARVICNEDDILMTRTGNTGQVITNVSGVFHNNFFLVGFDRKKINKKFLIKYFEDDGIYRDMLRRATTSTIPDLSHGEFYKMTIDLPPMELQNKFASIVEEIDKQKFSNMNILELLVKIVVL